MSSREKYKYLIKAFLINTGLVKLGSQLTEPMIAILRYHSIQEDPEHFANTIGTCIIHSRSVFKEQMELVARRFTPVTLDDILLFIKGEKEIPKKAVAVTFDDGFTDNYEIAAPILNHYGIRAAFFITVNSVETQKPPWFYRLRQAFFTTQRKEWMHSENGNSWKIENQEEKNTAFIIACEQCAKLVNDSQEDALKIIENDLEIEVSKQKNNIMMNWDQIKELQKAGHIIGSHTLTHPNLAYVEEKDLYRELILSKEIIEGKLGKSIIHFSYPSPILQPHWTETTVKATKEARYQTAVTCTPGPVCKKTNPLSLKRIWVPSEKNEFLWNLECTLLGRRM